VLKEKNFITRFIAVCLVSMLVLSSMGDVTQAVTLDSSYKLYMVANAHLDTGWMWPYQHTADFCIPDTFFRALEGLESDASKNSTVGAYSFVMSASKHYEWFKEYYNNDWQRLVDLVHTNQWEVTGGQVVESDLQCPGGEALVRQSLYAQHFFEKEFGKEYVPKVCFHPDTFGYSGNFPQFIRKSEMEYFAARRMGSIPATVFWWQGIDGSDVLAYSLPGSAGGPLSNDTIQNLFDQTARTPGAKHTLSLFGSGDHGGGPYINGGTSSNYSDVAVSNSNTAATVQYGTLEGYFTELAADNPGWAGNFPLKSGELYYPAFRGCYTSWSRIKKYNRQNEILAETAEKASTLGYWAAALENNSSDRIETAWDRILTNQFHDVLPGSSVPALYYEAFNKHEQARNLLTNVHNNALLGLAYRADTRAAGIPVFTYNPLSWDRDGEVTVRLTFEGALPDYIKIMDGSEEMPTHVLERDEATRAMKVSFIAKSVPAMGYKVFDAVASAAPSDFYSALSFDENAWIIQNEYLTLTLNPDTGYIKSLINKENGRESFAQNAGTEANELHVYVDKGDPGSPAWSVIEAEINKEPEIFFDSKPIAMEIVENSTEQVTIRVVKKWGDTIVLQYISMYQGIDRVDVRMEVDWTQPNHLLKVSFPILADADEASYEIAYGALKRPTLRSTSQGREQFEQSGHKWIDITDRSGAYGVSILNDAKYGYDVWRKAPGDNVNAGKNGEETFVRARITVVRSPVSPGLIGELRGTDYSQYRPFNTYIDMNSYQEFIYSIYPHKDSWEDAGTVREAHELCYPIQAFPTASHDSNGLSNAHSFMSVGEDTPNIIIGAVKNPYEGPNDNAGSKNTFIVRVYESSGKDTDSATITMPANVISAEEVNMLEHTYPDGRGNDPSKIVISGKDITLKSVGKFEIITLKVQIDGFDGDNAALPQVVVNLSPYFNYNGITPDTARSGLIDGFDGAGGSIPKEKWVDTIDYMGVKFEMAKASDTNNFVAADGQTIDLPQGNYNKVYLVGASAGNLANAGDFTIKYSDGSYVTKNIEFSGWLTDLCGWDKETNMDAKPTVFDSIAHVFSHYHYKSADQCDVNNYLFVYGIEVDSGKTLASIDLPNAPGIKIAAISASNSPIPGFAETYDAGADKPAVVTDVIANLSKDHFTVNIEWEWAGTDVSRYEVYCGTTPNFTLGEAVNKISVHGSQPNAVFEPDSLASYYFRVVALYKNGLASAPSVVSNAVRAGFINYCLPDKRAEIWATDYIAQQQPDNACDGSPYNGQKWGMAKVDPITNPGQLVVQIAEATEDPVCLNRFKVYHAGVSENSSLNTVDYDIDYSLDGTIWVTAVNVRGNTDSITVNDLTNTIQAKYVRLNILRPSLADTVTNTASIYQFLALGFESQPEEADAPTRPDPAANVTAEVLDDNCTVMVCWDAPENVNVQSYTVYRGTSKDFIPNESSKIGTVADTASITHKPDQIRMMESSYYKVVVMAANGMLSLPSNPSNVVNTFLEQDYCLYPTVAKAVWASSFTNANEVGPNACNGDVNSSKWCSTNTDMRQLYVKLADEADPPVDIMRFMIYHAGRDTLTMSNDNNFNYITSAYDIDYALDGITAENAGNDSLWTNAVSVTGNLESITTDKLDTPIMARYLRLNIVRGQQNGATARIYGFMAYGQKIVKETNFCLPQYRANVWASSEIAPREVAEFACDGDVNGTKWCTIDPIMRQLYVKLTDESDDPLDISSFMIYHCGRDSITVIGDDNPNYITRAYDIDYATNGITVENASDDSLWTNAVSVSNNSDPITSHLLGAPVKARYLRLNVEQTARIYEFMAFGHTPLELFPVEKATDVTAAVSAHDQTAVDITWAAPTSGSVARYIVYYGSDPGFALDGATRVGCVDGNITAIKFTPPDAGEYYFKVVVIDEGGRASNLSDPSAPPGVNIGISALLGLAVIDNTNPTIGDTLSASLVNGNIDLATANYIWKADDSVVGGGTNSYTVTLADLSKRITVEISDGIHVGLKTSLSTAKVEKLDPVRALKPVLESKTATSVTLVSIPGYEYAYAPRSGFIPTAFQPGAEFIDLDPDTEYDFYQRISETIDTKASAVAPMLIVKTNPESNGYYLKATVEENKIKAAFSNNTDSLVTIRLIAAVYFESGALINVEMKDSVLVSSDDFYSYTFSIMVSDYPNCTFKVFAWNQEDYIPLCDWIQL